MGLLIIAKSVLEYAAIILLIIFLVKGIKYLNKKNAEKNND